MIRILYLFIVLMFVAACSGGTSSPAPTAPTPLVNTPDPTPAPPVPTGPPTITITAAGMTPLEITIAVGQRVLFINNDVRAHDLVGGVDPSHPECPEILQAGFLSAGQRIETGVFTTARTCPYHDHTELSVPAFSGRIIIK